LTTPVAPSKTKTLPRVILRKVREKYSLIALFVVAAWEMPVSRRLLASDRSPTLRAVMGALVCVACASHRPAQTPEDAVRAYSSAIEEGRLQDAYQMLSDESRSALTYAAFEDLVKAHPEEVKALTASLKEQSEAPLVTATITTRTGEVLQLHYEDGAWRISKEAVALYGQDEPRQTLASFVRAYDNKRYDVLLRFVPDGQSAGLTKELLKDSWEGELKIEMEQTVEALRPDIQTGSLEVLGDTATLSYGAGSVVELSRQHGLWKIEDF
jgi:hypothetical protein